MIEETDQVTEEKTKQATKPAKEEDQPQTPPAEIPPNRADALKQRHQDTEDRLKGEGEERKQHADEAQQRMDAALEREKEMNS
jgi:hypothetical protein